MGLGTGRNELKRLDEMIRYNSFRPKNSIIPLLPSSILITVYNQAIWYFSDLVNLGQALPLLIKSWCYKFRVNFLLMKKLLHDPRAFFFC